MVERLGGRLTRRALREKYFDSSFYLSIPGIPYKKCGKLIVATDPTEIQRLNDLHERALLNNVPGIEMIDGSKIKEYEPYCKVKIFKPLLKEIIYSVIDLIQNFFFCSLQFFLQVFFF